MLKRLNFCWFLLSLFATLFCVSCNTQTDEVDQGIAAVLPSNTTFLLYFPNLLPHESGFDATNLGKLIQEPEFQAAIQPIYDEVKPLWDMITQGQGEQLNKAQLQEYFNGEITIAIIGLPEGDAVPEILVSFGVTDRFASEAVFHLEDALKQKGLPATELTIEGETFYQTVTPQGIPMFVGVYENRFLLTTSKTLAAKIITPTNTLAKSPHFSELQKHIRCSGNNVVQVYMNLEQIFSNPLAAMSMQPTLEPLGIWDWKSFAIAYAQENQSQRLAVSVYCPGEKRGITKILSGAETQSSLLSLVPADAVSYQEWNWDLCQSWKGLLEIIKNNCREQEFANLQQYFKPERFTDFFAAHDKEMAIFGRDSIGGGFFQETIILATLQNPQTSRTQIESFFKSWDMELQKIEYSGYEIHYWQNKMGNGERFAQLPTNFDPNLISMILPYRAYFFVNDKTVAYSTLVQNLKNYADFLAKKEANLSGILQPRLQEIGPHSSLSWQNKGTASYAAGYRNMLKQLQSFEGVVRDLGVPLEIGKFPSPAFLEKYWFPSVCIGYSEQNTMSLVGYTSGLPDFSALDMPETTLGTTAVMAVPVIAAIAIPGLLRARTSANENAAVGCLKSLCTSQYEFQNKKRVDQDRDGIGEFGFIQELAGISKVRSKNITDSLIAHEELATSASANNGIATYKGYCFACYLPSSKEYLRESAPITKMTLTKTAIDMQEKDFLIYAWPENYGSTGIKTFVINNNGQVFVSGNSKTCYSGKSKIPDFNAALIKNKNVWELKPGVGSDGETWAAK